MKKSSKKLIAPIVITILLIVNFSIFLISWIFIPIPAVGKLVGTLIPLGLIWVSIYILIERIKEIRSGEEDDLSKY